MADNGEQVRKSLFVLPFVNLAVVAVTIFELFHTRNFLVAVAATSALFLEFLFLWWRVGRALDEGPDLLGRLRAPVPPGKLGARDPLNPPVHVNSVRPGDLVKIDQR